MKNPDKLPESPVRRRTVLEKIIREAFRELRIGIINSDRIKASERRMLLEGAALKEREEVRKIYRKEGLWGKYK